MKISIVIPVYNVEQYIEDCLKSVAAQTYEGEMECIIIDDCTPDNSCVIINEFIQQYNGPIEFRLQHHTKNRGLSAARNTGIDASTGDYIYFLDSDDELTPNAIELLSAPLKERLYDFVIGDYRVIGPNNHFPELLLNDRTIVTDKDIRSTFFTNQWYMMAWNKLCNQKFICENKLYFKEGLLNEDNLWSFQLACLANSMFVIKKDTYIYKVRESSIMGTIDCGKTADAFATIAHEAYRWAKCKNLIYEQDIFNKIQFYRFIALNNIYTQDNNRNKKKIYTKCHQRLRIECWHLYKKGLLSRNSAIRELYSYFPGILGYWYLYLYRKVRKGVF